MNIRCAFLYIILIFNSDLFANGDVSRIVFISTPPSMKADFTEDRIIIERTKGKDDLSKDVDFYFDYIYLVDSHDNKKRIGCIKSACDQIKSAGGEVCRYVAADFVLSIDDNGVKSNKIAILVKQGLDFKFYCFATNPKPDDKELKGSHTSINISRKRFDDEIEAESDAMMISERSKNGSGFYRIIIHRIHRGDYKRYIDTYTLSMDNSDKFKIDHVESDLIKENN